MLLIRRFRHVWVITRVSGLTRAIGPDPSSHHLRWVDGQRDRLPPSGTSQILREAMRRRRQQLLEVPPDPLDEDDESRVPSWMVDHSLPEPDVLVEQGERRQLLQQLIEELPEEKRAVFRLVHDAEMETRQVAQTLGIPEGTVKSRLHYATRRLAQKWRDLQHEWEDMA